MKQGNSHFSNEVYNPLQSIENIDPNQWCIHGDVRMKEEMRKPMVMRIANNNWNEISTETVKREFERRAGQTNCGWTNQEENPS